MSHVSIPSTPPVRVRIVPTAATALMIATGVTLGADYVVTDLGTIVGGATAAPGSAARALGGDGSVVGESVVGDLDGLLHGFVWRDGAITALAPPAGLSLALATAAIDADHVYGTAYDLGALDTHAVRWDFGAPTALGAWELTDVAPDGTAVGGTVAGSLAAHRRPVRWTGGTLIDLPLLGGRDGIALAIAANGDIAGISALADETRTRGVLWRAGAPIDLGTLGGPSSRAHDVNALGQVAGDADLPGGGFHACLFGVDPAGNVTREDLGAMGAYSSARGLNGLGTIVGTSDSRAFVWRDGAMTDLNTLIDPAAGWQLYLACDVDDAGRIVGAGLHDGQPRAFLLTPRRPEDLNGDGVVSFADLLIVLGSWGPCDPGPCAGDTNGDGVVDFQDILRVLGAWG